MIGGTPALTFWIHLAPATCDPERDSALNEGGGVELMCTERVVSHSRLLRHNKTWLGII